MSLLGLVGKMYSKIQCCRRVSGTNHRDTKDTKIDHYYISYHTKIREPPNSATDSPKRKVPTSPLR